MNDPCMDDTEPAIPLDEALIATLALLLPVEHRAYAKRTPLPADVVDERHGWATGTTAFIRTQPMTDAQLATATAPAAVTA